MFANKRFIYFVCCFVVVICHTNSMHDDHHKVEINHDDMPEEKCQNVNLKHYLSLSKCRPVDTVVHIVGSYDVSLIIPNQVTVKRCYSKSTCNSHEKCMPIKTRKIKVGVRMQYKFHGKYKCGWVNVIEHETCKCGCDLNQKECKRQNKIFNVQDCSCDCPLTKEKANCTKHMVWDKKNCECTCTTESMSCGTGSVWVPAFCGCRVVMNGYIVN